MAEQAQNIENITVDGAEYAIADLPEGVQTAVATYGDWQRRAAEAQSEVNILQAALRDLGSNIVQAVREVKAADDAAAAEAAGATTEDAAPEVVENDASPAE